MFDINGWEFGTLVVLAMIIIGPERLSEYTALLRSLIRQGRAVAQTAQRQFRQQVGPEFDSIDWNQYDPRRYDPRRIVGEAFLGSEDRGDRGDSV